MQIIYNKIIIILIITVVFYSCGKEEPTSKIKSTNYIVVWDLSDRILLPDQLEKDCFLIEKYYRDFEKKARRNLILTSKDRFTVKIIPQKNSPLNYEDYEDLLHIYLDETEVKDKNKSISSLSQTITKTMKSLKEKALYSHNSKDYFGVDIWAYLHDNGKKLSKPGYDNKILVITDGYFDFENHSHVIKENNQYTSTRFLNDLNTVDWKHLAESKTCGLLPIQLDKNTKWIVAGIAGKKANDILQTEKITYFWKKWLIQSGVTSPNVILNGSKSDMISNLNQYLE